MEKLHFLQQKTGSVPGYAAFFRFYVYQNDIRADPLHAAPGDHKVVPLSEKSEIPAGAGDDQGVDAALRQLDNCIADKAQPPPVVDTDDLFAVQVGKFV